MSWLSKGIKKARKALHIPAITLGNVAKVGAGIATGGVAGGALALGSKVLKSKLKSAAIGGIKQVMRTKADKALAKRIGMLAPPRVVDIRAQTMPGGAPLRGIRQAARRVAAASPKPSKRRRKAAVRPAAATKSKRKAPTGGKDFKALSVSWRAAGKPGRWIDWVKGH